MRIVAAIFAIKICLIACNTLRDIERVVELYKCYRDMPVYRETILHAPAVEGSEAILTIRKQLQSVIDGKKRIESSISEDHFDCFHQLELPEIFYPFRFSLWDENLAIEKDVLFRKTPILFHLSTITYLEESQLNFYFVDLYLEGYSANSSTLPAVFSDPILKDLLGNVITYRLVSVFFESEDHDFIRFLLEKVTGNWELVNKTETGPYKDLTFEAFRDAKLNPFRAVYEGIYVKESLLDDFFNYKFGDKVVDKEDEFIPDDENVSNFPISRAKIDDMCGEDDAPIAIETFVEQDSSSESSSPVTNFSFPSVENSNACQKASFVPLYLSSLLIFLNKAI